MAESVTVAQRSIPNTGESTLFNRLSEASQSAGNWDGTSVEKRVGSFDLWAFRVDLVDLTGSYALFPVSAKERVVRAFFRRSPLEVVLNLLDARNLYTGLTP